MLVGKVARAPAREITRKMRVPQNRTSRPIVDRGGANRSFSDGV